MTHEGGGCISEKSFETLLINYAMKLGQSIDIIKTNIFQKYFDIFDRAFLTYQPTQVFKNQ